MNLPETDRTRLDNVSLEQRALLYPEELREPFVWLGCYLREECSREYDVLVANAKKLGVMFDKTTWSTIMRGKWNRDDDGNLTEHPKVKLDKLLKAIAVLRSDSRIKEQGGRIPFVETSITRTIFDYVDKKRAPDRVCKFGVVIGETGNQKTAAFKEYCRQNNHGACVWLDAPETPSIYRFKTDLAVRYGRNPQESLPKKEAAIFDAVNERKTIIVENIQRLYEPRLEGKQPVFDFLQKLQETTGCTIILSFTPTFDKVFTGQRARGFFEQFEGRAGGGRTFLRLPEYPPEEDVLTIAHAFKLSRAESHLEYLVNLSKQPGRIRILFETLQEAKIRAERRKETLTIEHLKYVRDED